MSFFDKMAKAVSDTVDRGKKEVDQFMRVQKVKGEISQTEHQIQDASAQVQRVKQEIGEKAIEMVRAGTLVSTELQTLVDRITGIEHDIAAHQAVIVEKKAEIVRIEAEDQAPTVQSPEPQVPAQVVATPSASAPPTVPVVPPLPGTPEPLMTVPPPLPPAAERVCPQCSVKLPSSVAFCTECGAKIG
jgi:seryl-tRNA synthetase